MDYILELCFEYGLLACCLAIFLEYACFPLPSEVVLPLAGAIAVNNGINFFLIVALSVGCGLLGSSVCYFIGLFGGKAMIDKIKNKFPKLKNGLNTAQEQFDKYSALSISIGRLIPICRTYISFIAGANAQKYWKFLLFTTFGVMVWNFALIGLGYVFCDNLSTISDIYSNYKYIVLAIVAVLLVVLIAKHIKRRK